MIKKIIFMLIVVCCLCGCEQPNTTPVKKYTCTNCTAVVEKEGDTCSNCITAQKLALYNRVIGDWETEGFNNYSEGKEWLTVSFKESSVVLDGTEYSLDIPSCLYFEEEVPEEWRWRGKTFYFLLNGKYFSIIIEDNDNIKLATPYYSESMNRNNAITTWLDRITTDTGASGGADSNSSIAGSYSFETATGTQVNGSLTLDNGTWSYSGNKTNVAATTGSYTVNGSSVTFSWTSNGFEISETVTISTNGSTSTWTSDGVTFFSMLFGVADFEMIFSYSN